MDLYQRVCFVFLFVGFVLIQDCKTATVKKQSNWWSKGVVPFVLDYAFPQDIKIAILSAMQEIEAKVNTPESNSPCIRFLGRTNEKDFLNITHTPGCHSTVGYSEIGLKYMSVGRGCETRGILMHELVHALGLYHEQNRPDRHRHIVINNTNIKFHHFHNFRIKPDMDTFGLAYDYGSILHYGPYHLASNFRYPVIVPNHNLDEDVVMGQREKLSPYDVLKVQRAYKCKEDISYAVTHSRNYLVNCHFVKSLCNMKLGAGSEFDWMVKNGSEVNGPYAGHSTGIDSYLVATDDGNNKGKVARIVSPPSNGGPLCLDFYLYQKGPTSYLDIIASGAEIPTLTIRSYKGVRQNYWRRVIVGVNVADSAKVRITLEAHVDSGAVALDDVKMYHGKCGK